MEYLKTTGSTNDQLRKLMKERELTEGFALRTDFQETGRGQGSNLWESEQGKNLLCSILLYPNHVPIAEQFLVSQIVSLALYRLLSEYAEGVSIKWPNDIYWNEKKIAGILIENAWQGAVVKSSIIGIGLNLNQELFVSDAPNPVSLKQITGKNFDIDKVLSELLNAIQELYGCDADEIRSLYMDHLYRREGFYAFAAEGKEFMAQIQSVDPDGQIKLSLQDGSLQGYYFKEVEFMR